MPGPTPAPPQIMTKALEFRPWQATSWPWRNLCLWSPCLFSYSCKKVSSSERDSALSVFEGFMQSRLVCL